MDARIDFNIGWDFAAYGLHLPSEVSTGLRDGYAAGQSKFRRPIGEADRYVRKWLQLRHNASKRGRLFEDDVTPEWLREIDVRTCPITGEPLTHAAMEDSDWSIDRIVNDGSYARPNLAVMSTRANKAKGNKSIHEICSLSRSSKAVDGLTPQEWYRLAGFVFGSYAYAKQIHPLQEVYPFTPLMPDHIHRSWAQTIQTILIHKYLQKNNTGTRFLVLKESLSCKTGKTLLSKLEKRMKKVAVTPRIRPFVMLDQGVFSCYLELHHYYLKKLGIDTEDNKNGIFTPFFDSLSTSFQNNISIKTRGFTA